MWTVLLTMAVAQVQAPYCKDCVASAPTARVVSRSTQAPMVWVRYPDNPTQVFLMRGEKTLGGWDEVSEVFRDFFAGDQWGPPRQPPIAPPFAEKSETSFFFGVDPEKRCSRDRVSLNGVEIALADATELVVGSKQTTLPDDHAKPHLSFICSDAATCKKVRKDLSTPEGKELSGLYRVQVYDLERAPDKIMLAKHVEVLKASKQEGPLIVTLQETGEFSPLKRILRYPEMPVVKKLKDQLSGSGQGMFWGSFVLLFLAISSMAERCFQLVVYEWGTPTVVLGKIALLGCVVYLFYSKLKKGPDQ